MRNRSHSSSSRAAQRSRNVINQRNRSRQKAVLPARVCGVDNAGNAYSELVHTLDVAGTGAQLGAVRCDLQPGSVVTLQYKQHKADFRVVWVVKRPCGKEYQVGLQAVVERDVWGLDAEVKTQRSAARA